MTYETLSRLPVGFDKISNGIIERLNDLAIQLMVDYQKNRELYIRTSKKTGESKFDAYYPMRSKLIIDEIDKVLALHYGFTDEELDFIPSASLRTGINYDIKYRMGKELEGEDEE